MNNVQFIDWLKAKHPKGFEKLLAEFSEDTAKRKVPFSVFWDAYAHKCQTPDLIKKKWDKLLVVEQEQAMKHVPFYVASTPDKKYRKMPGTYINQKAWNDNGYAKQKADEQAIKQRYAQQGADAWAALLDK